MSSTRKVIAVIPSRKGSKGLPGKNIRPLCGEPLLAYTVKQAVAAGCFDRIIVSTDCEEIADTARQYGAETPFLRPGELAGDRSDLKSALNYTLNELARRESYHPDVMAVMFPTYPFRTKELIRKVVDTAREEAAAVRCVFPADINPAMLVAPRRGEVWRMKPVLKDDMVVPEAHRSRRLMALMGNIRAEVVLPGEIRCEECDALRKKTYLEKRAAEGDRRFKNWRVNIVVVDPILQIDINYESEFRLAEKVLERGLFRFEDSREMVVQS